ncbi:unnamed protein product [Sphacelaria rigidula]
MTSIKLVMAVAVQRGWPLYHFDVTQAFVRAKMDTSVFMELLEGCGNLTGGTVRLEKSIYGVTQVGRQCPLLLNKTLMEDVRMSQSKADPCIQTGGRGGSVCHTCCACGRHSNWGRNENSGEGTQYPKQQIPDKQLR